MCADNRRLPCAPRSCGRSSACRREGARGEERAEAGAEIVHGYFDARAPRRLQLARAFVDVVDQHALGDLDIEERRGPPSAEIASSTESTKSFCLSCSADTLTEVRGTSSPRLCQRRMSSTALPSAQRPAARIMPVSSRSETKRDGGAEPSSASFQRIRAQPGHRAAHHVDLGLVMQRERAVFSARRGLLHR